MNRVFSRRPSPAMAVAFVALLAALSGTAVALPGRNTVDSGDLKRAAVKTADIARNAVRGNKVRNGSLTGADTRDDSLTGADIDESTLGQVPSAAAATTANNANNANSANTAGTVSNGAITPAKFGTIPAVHVEHSVSQPGAGTLSFDTEEFDTADMHDNTTNNSRLTAPIDGIYLLTAVIGWDLNNTGSRVIRFEKNASTIAFDTEQAVQGDTTFQTLTTTARLAAGDFITVGASSTVAVNVFRCGPDGCPEFTMNWLAP